MENRTYSPVELRLPSFRSAVVGCMDEGIHVDGGLIYFGTGGTGLVRLDGGDEKKFPIESRLLTASVIPVAFRSLNKIAANIGIPINYTSHQGCGWAAAQGINTDEEVMRETVNLVTMLKNRDSNSTIDYAGHITPSEHPLGLTEDVHACLKRFGEEHCARNITITTGGGITREEKEDIEALYGPSFVISADWVGEASKELEADDIAKFLWLQVKVASGIMGETTPLPIRHHDAGRLPISQISQNNDIVQRLLFGLKRSSM